MFQIKLKDAIGVAILFGVLVTVGGIWGKIDTEVAARLGWSLFVLWGTGMLIYKCVPNPQSPQYIYILEHVIVAGLVRLEPKLIILVSLFLNVIKLFCVGNWSYHVCDAFVARGSTP
jgi:hypothetical protein